MVSEILRLGRHAPDRLLHPLRRRAARADLTRRVAPSSMLVICHGNICRSPFAAAVLRARLAGTGVCVESAGFFGPGRLLAATQTQLWLTYSETSQTGKRPRVSRQLSLSLLQMISHATVRRAIVYHSLAAVLVFRICHSFCT